MPQEASVAFLQQAKKEKRLAIEDFRDDRLVVIQLAAHAHELGSLAGKYEGGCPVVEHALASSQ